MASQRSDLLLKSFNSREEFENHEEHQKEASQYNGVDISFNPNKFGEGVTDMREGHYKCHATPDDDTNEELEECLVTRATEKIFETLEKHESSEENNDDLVESKMHRNNV